MSFERTTVSWFADLAIYMASRDQSGVELMFPPPLGIIGNEVGDKISRGDLTVIVSPRGWTVQRMDGLEIEVRDQGEYGMTSRGFREVK